MTESRVFKSLVRVPYAHTDQMKFVYYANYFVYFEMARADMLREIGLPYTQMEAEGVLLPVIEAHCDYKTPAHYDDQLCVTSRCQLDGTRLWVEYVVTRGDTVIVTGHTVHVCISPDGKVRRPSPALRALVSCE